MIGGNGNGGSQYVVVPTIIAIVKDIPIEIDKAAAKITLYSSDFPNILENKPNKKNINEAGIK